MKQTEVTFTIDGFLPPSSNHAIKQGKNHRRYPSDELKQWQQVCSLQKIQKIVDSEFYGVEYYFYYPYYFKNGNLRKKDQNNLTKYALDALIKRLVTTSGEPIDDCRVKDERTISVDHKKLKVVVTFYALI